ncbi:MAG: Glutamate synthase large chain [Pseudomonadota bacterium]
MLNWIDQRVPVRFLAFFVVVALWVLSALQLVVGQASLAWVLLLSFLVVVGIHDLQQTRHAVLRNYPIIGHLRFLLEFIRPELRQYFIEGDADAVPFSRSQRSLVYSRAKGEPDKRPFGTQMNVHEAGYECGLRVVDTFHQPLGH